VPATAKSMASPRRAGGPKNTSPTTRGTICGSDRSLQVRRLTCRWAMRSRAGDSATHTLPLHHLCLTAFFLDRSVRHPPSRFLSRLSEEIQPTATGSGRRVDHAAPGGAMEKGQGSAWASERETPVSPPGTSSLRIRRPTCITVGMQFLSSRPPIFKAPIFKTPIFKAPILRTRRCR